MELEHSSDLLQGLLNALVRHNLRLRQTRLNIFEVSSFTIQYINSLVATKRANIKYIRLKSSIQN